MNAHAQGLIQDLESIPKLRADSRSSLRWLASGAASLLMSGCGGAGNTTMTTNANSATSSDTGTSSGTSTRSCIIIPEEAASPNPGDGTNSNGRNIVNLLTMSGKVRQDIRSIINDASGTASGTPFTIKLTFNDAKTVAHLLMALPCICGTVTVMKIILCIQVAL